MAALVAPEDTEAVPVDLDLAEVIIDHRWAEECITDPRWVVECGTGLPAAEVAAVAYSR